MDNKLTIQDLVAVFVEKDQLQEHEALKFVTSVFQVIREGLERDKLVKIKGLGTFKLVDVDSRESVNVNNGERVLIEGHTKISFLPDATMKELVNKPFSSFETVILNEGVEFGDMTEPEPAIIDEDADEEEPAPAPPVAQVEIPKEENTEELLIQLVEDTPAEEEPVVETPAEEEAVVETPVEEDPVEETPVEEEPVVETPVEEEAVVETPVEEEPVVEQPVEEPIEEEEEEEPGFRYGWILWLLLCAACFAAGFYLGRTTVNPMDETAQKKPVAVDSIAKPATDSLQAEPTDSLQAEPTDSLATDALKAQTDKDSTAVKQQPTAVEKPAVRQPEPDYLKYDAMDERVRTGAYYIMGTDTVLTVKEGETLYRISKRTLGTDMMCYIEVYNGVTPATLKTGQKLKIPKLELKKLVRKRMEKKQ